MGMAETGEDNDTIAAAGPDCGCQSLSRSFDGEQKV